MKISERMKMLGYGSDMLGGDSIWKDWGVMKRERLFTSSGNDCLLTYDPSAQENGFVLRLSAPPAAAGGKHLDVAFFPDGRLARALHGDEIIEDADEAVRRWIQARDARLVSDVA